MGITKEEIKRLIMIGVEIAKNGIYDIFIADGDGSDSVYWDYEKIEKEVNEAVDLEY